MNFEDQEATSCQLNKGKLKNNKKYICIQLFN